MSGTATLSSPPKLRLERGESGVRAFAEGNWTLGNLSALVALKAHADGQGQVGVTGDERITLDSMLVGGLDPSGAVILLDLLGPALDLDSSVMSVAQRHLLEKVRKALGDPQQPSVSRTETSHLRRFVVGLGHATEHFIAEVADSIRFLGQMLVALLRVIFQPGRLRGHAVLHHMEEAGIDAIPLVATLSFFIGMVLAFMSSRLLGQFGASLLTVDLVSIAMLREFGVVMTAIILAGRSDSAFTAQIGAMRMQKEIDAMQVMGVDPIEALVVPRAIATLFMVPLLSVVAMASGIVGGMLVAWNAFDLSPILFLARMQEVVPVDHFWAGIAKAPVFALIMALVGCRQGMLVGGTVASLGQRTTSSVVQAIFLVIVVDALFAMLYLELDI